MSSIREVARLAGVSPATVSRVMNGTAKVDQEKMRRVLQVIKETDFRPNEVARSLFKKSSKIIGVIIPDIENPFFSEMAKAIEEEAYTSGYRLILCNSGNYMEKEKSNIQILKQMNADGIIIMTNHEEIWEEIQNCEIPVVVLDRQIKGSKNLISIQSDHYKGGRMAAKHLLDCGSRQMVLMRGPQKFSSARARFAGYVDICKEYGKEVQYVDCEYDYKDGILQTEKLLEEFPNVDSIVACNDMVAISAYKVLRQKGYHIPRDIQIIGFDNISLSRIVTPEITTVAQPISLMGTKAAQIIMNATENQVEQEELIFPVKLIKRGTTIEK